MPEFDSHRRAGIGTILIVVVLVLVIVVAGASYVFVFSGKASAPNTSSGTTTTSIKTTTTISVPTFTASSSASTLALKYYSGTFSYKNPIGPSGERVLSNNTVQTYGSLQSASGSFTFFVNPANYTGFGTGTGTMKVTTTGFCSGSVTYTYSFKLTATNVPGSNLTIGFDNPTPANFTVPLTCTGPMQGVDTSTNNPCPYLATYPGLVTVKSLPYSVNENLAGGTSYSYSLAATN